MRIKLDENLPTELIDALGAMGHEVEDVYGEQLSGHIDPEVWEASQREQRLLITQDIAFGDARMFRPGQHAGFVLVRLKRPGRGALLLKLSQVFASENVESWSGCFVVVSDSKIRVRRPE